MIHFYDGDCYTGFPRFLESPWNYVGKISRTWKVPENEFGNGKPWKSKCKVLENPGIS